jgi:hypothetical protein
MAANHGIESGLFVKSELVLPKDGDALAGADADCPFVRFDLAGQDLEEGRFP